MPPAPPSSLDARARAAVALLAAASRASPLPDVGDGGWERHATLLVPRGVPTADLPAQLRDLATTPAEHPVPAVPARWSRPGRTTAPHAVLLSRIATSRVRFRTFPLTGDGDEGRWTLTVHSRRRWAPGRLAVAGRTQLDVSRSGAVDVPRVLAWGRSAGGEWLAEEEVVGRHLRADELFDAAAGVAAGLAAHWAATGRGVRPHRVGPGRTDAVLELLSDQAAAGREVTSSRTAVRALGAAEVRMTVGTCHGDPVVGNVLATPDGRRVLLDWEHAGPGLVARDLVKAVLGAPDPEQGWDLLAGVGADALSPPGLDASPWRVQVATALVDWLSTWRQDQDRQRASGRSRPFARQLGKRLDLLGRVLAG